MLNLLIDGKNFCFRASVIEQGLATKQGKPVGTIFTTLNMLHKLLEDYKPDRVIFAWDEGKSQWRRDLLESYKRNQKSSMANGTLYEILDQITELREEVLPMLPVIQFAVKKQEADDLICAATITLYKLGDRSIIVSTDQDYYQLLEFADIANTATGAIFNKHSFQSKFGFPSFFFLPYRAMVGDRSDNIHGIDGVGPKRAKELLLYRGEFNEHPKLGKYFTQEAYERFELNQKLISLLNYPQRPMLQKKFVKAYNNHTSEFKEKEFKEYLMHNQMFSILANVQNWKQPFLKLEG